MARSRIFGALAIVLLLLPAMPAPAQEATSWGWPLPYERISEGSVAWLKQTGWWPLGIAWQAPASGQNATNIVMAKLDLLGKRGIEASFRAFAAGPAINEAIISERMQVGTVGNVPFVRLIEAAVPVKALAVIAPTLRHSVVVRLDSAVHGLADLKAANRPQVIGLVMGSSAQFYFEAAAEQAGLAIGEDVVLKDTPIDKQLLLGSGLAAVVAWEPSVTILTEQRQTGRQIDTIDPYNFYMAYLLVRRELVENVPDVVQAISDARQEADLWIRVHPGEAAAMLAAEPMLHGDDEALLLRQIELYNNRLKPTASYPFVEFWSQENARIGDWLFTHERTKRVVGTAELAAAVDARFIDRTYEKLGWKIPARPPFLPKDWPGKVGEPPYPPYLSAATMSAPQAWPERGDLIRPWSFDGRTYRP